MTFSSSSNNHHRHDHRLSSSSSLSSILICILIVIAISSSTNAFIFDTTTPPGGTTTLPPSIKDKKPAFPGLMDIAKQQVDQRLKFQILIENPSDKESIMALDGLSLKLLDEDDDSQESSTLFTMPGDLTSDVSSGQYDLSIDSKPSFVGMDGYQTIDVEGGKGKNKKSKSKWELVWREGDIAGNLILGMPIQSEAQRNLNGGAKLPKGHMYLSFLIWTKDYYNGHLDKVHLVAKEANEHWQKSQDMLNEMETTSNIFEKASLYTSAREEHSTYVKLHHQFNYLWQMTPLEQDLIELSSGLLILSTGTAWTDNGECHHTNKQQKQQSHGTGGSLWAAAAASSSSSSSDSTTTSGGFYLLGKAQLIK